MKNIFIFLLAFESLRVCADENFQSTLKLERFDKKAVPLVFEVTNAGGIGRIDEGVGTGLRSPCPNQESSACKALPSNIREVLGAIKSNCGVSPTAVLVEYNGVQYIVDAYSDGYFKKIESIAHCKFEKIDVPMLGGYIGNHDGVLVFDHLSKYNFYDGLVQYDLKDGSQKIFMSDELIYDMTAFSDSGDLITNDQSSYDFCLYRSVNRVYQKQKCINLSVNAKSVYYTVLSPNGRYLGVSYQDLEDRSSFYIRVVDLVDENKK